MCNRWWFKKIQFCVSDGNKVEPSKPNNNIYSYHSPPSTRKNKQGTLRTSTEHNSNQNDDKDNKENIRTVNGQLGVRNNKHLKGDVGRLSDARMEREKKLKSRQKRLTAVAEVGHSQYLANTTLIRY